MKNIEKMKKAHEISKKKKEQNGGLNYLNEVNDQIKNMKEEETKIEKEAKDNRFFIILGLNDYENDDTTLSYEKITIEKETEKAIKIKTESYLNFKKDGEIESKNNGMLTESEDWIPKSQINIFDNYFISIPDWLRNKIDVKIHRLITNRKNEELKEINDVVLVEDFYNARIESIEEV